VSEPLAPFTANIDRHLMAAPLVPTGSVPRVVPTGNVGDINSAAKGSGARYNAGKVALELIPLRLLAKSYTSFVGSVGDAGAAVRALDHLGRWQETGDAAHLYSALRELGLDEGWRECAAAFDYGRRKYAEWNWAKGMAWSVPLACAARHLLALIQGKEHLDTESGVHHRGHVFCNVVMLLQYSRTYPEGDDRPRCLGRAG